MAQGRQCLKIIFPAPQGLFICRNGIINLMPDIMTPQVRLAFTIWDDHYDRGDPWASTMSPFFEVAEELYRRGEEIPESWEFRPGVGVNEREPAFPWSTIFHDMSSEELRTFGNIVEMQSDLLKAEGKDY